MSTAPPTAAALAFADLSRARAGVFLNEKRTFFMTLRLNRALRALAALTFTAAVAGLAAAVMSADGERCERVAAAFRAGIVWINCSQPTFTEAPWGGYKQSGIGRELGRWGLDNYLETKQITRLVSDEAWGWYLK